MCKSCIKATEDFGFSVILVSLLRLILLSLSDPAEAEYLSEDNSDEENDEKEEDEERREGVTSMDEALRTITDSGGCDRADFLKQNFETLSEGCTTGNTERTDRRALSFREITLFSLLLGARGRRLIPF